MARLKKCKSCGNMIAKDAKICPQCGGRVKKSHGCLLIIIFAILSLIAIRSAGNGKTSGENKPSSNDAFQVEKFSNDGAMIFVQNFLENNVSKSVKYTSPANIANVPESVAEPFRKFGVNPKNLFSVSQEFTESNAIGVELNHKYNAIVEFKSGAGYRLLTLVIDDVLLYPKK